MKHQAGLGMACAMHTNTQKCITAGMTEKRQPAVDT